MIDAVKQYYECTCNWTGEKYIGLTIKWDYKGQKVHISMPNYVANALQSFHHRSTTKLKHHPYTHVNPTYGARMTQYAKVEDVFDKAGKKFIQEVCGVFLYLAQAISGGLLLALSALASQQANPTKKNMTLCKNFVNYMASQDKAILTYRASDMVLAIPSECNTYWKQMQGVGQADICS